MRVVTVTMILLLGEGPGKPEDVKMLKDTRSSKYAKTSPNDEFCFGTKNKESLKKRQLELRSKEELIINGHR